MMSKKTYRVEGEDGAVCPKCGSGSLSMRTPSEYKLEGDSFVLEVNTARRVIHVPVLSPYTSVMCEDCKNMMPIVDAIEAFRALPVEEDRNTNCLEGLKCPKCGSLEPFVIECKTYVLMHDEGSDEVGNFEWSNDSFCKCTGCEFHATIADFSFMEKNGNDEDA